MGEKFEKDLPTSYIQYLDANNLYGWAMQLELPVGGFKWMSDSEVSLAGCSEGTPGTLLRVLEEIPHCFIKVDLEYPKELHHKFSELVPAPDKIKINGVEKLAPNLLKKEGYVCHIENLYLYISLGVKLTKIHSGVKF